MRLGVPYLTLRFSDAESADQSKHGSPSELQNSAGPRIIWNMIRGVSSDLRGASVALYSLWRRCAVRRWVFFTAVPTFCADSTIVYHPANPPTTSAIAQGLPSRCGKIQDLDGKPGALAHYSSLERHSAHAVVSIPTNHNDVASRHASCDLRLLLGLARTYFSSCWSQGWLYRSKHPIAQLPT